MVFEYIVAVFGPSDCLILGGLVERSSEEFWARVAVFSCVLPFLLPLEYNTVLTLMIITNVEVV